MDLFVPVLPLVAFLTFVYHYIHLCTFVYLFVPFVSFCRIYNVWKFKWDILWMIFKQCAIFSTKQSLAWICTCQIDDQSKLHFNDRWSYSPFITEELASSILVPNTEKKPSCNNVRDMSSNTNGLISKYLIKKIERTVWLAPIWNVLERCSKLEQWNRWWYIKYFYTECSINFWA